MLGVRAAVHARGDARRPMPKDGPRHPSANTPAAAPRAPRAWNVSTRPRRTRSRRLPPGSAPEALAPATRTDSRPLEVVHYDSRHHEERAITDARELMKWLGRPGVTWIHAVSPTAAQLGLLRSLLGLHPVVVSNIAHVPQRPRWQVFDEHDVLLLRAAVPDSCRTEQVSIIAGRRWVLSVEEAPRAERFDLVRQRLREAAGTLRSRSASYLAASLVLAIVDAFYPTVERLFDDIDQLTDRILAARTMPARELQQLRECVVELRHATWPARAALGAAASSDSPRVCTQSRILLDESVHDMDQVVGMIEEAQSSVASAGELLMNMVSWRTNEVMSLLAIVSTLFLPMTFLAGIWGMNFDTRLPGNMPELEWPYGYAFAWAAMLASAAAIILFLRRRRWLFPVDLDRREWPATRTGGNRQAAQAPSTSEAPSPRT